MSSTGVWVAVDERRYLQTSMPVTPGISQSSEHVRALPFASRSSTAGAIRKDLGVEVDRERAHRACSRFERVVVDNPDGGAVDGIRHSDLAYHLWQ